MLPRLAVVASIAATAASLVADESMIPATLPEAQKVVLKKFLADREKPTAFLPKKYVLQVLPGGENVVLDPDAEGQMWEYLSAVVPYRDNSKADVYYYRPNPKKGVPGVTVKVTVDLTTGAAEVPKVLVFYRAPLTKQELAEAVALAKDKVEAAKALYANDAVVQVAALMEMVTATGFADRSPGERVVTLQLRKKDGKDVLPVIVNLTRGTILKNGN